jgi:hypothetical protein
VTTGDALEVTAFDACGDRPAAEPQPTVIPNARIAMNR